MQGYIIQVESHIKLFGTYNSHGSFEECMELLPHAITARHCQYYQTQTITIFSVG